MSDRSGDNKMLGLGIKVCYPQVVNAVPSFHVCGAPCTSSRTSHENAAIEISCLTERAEAEVNNPDVSVNYLRGACHTGSSWASGKQHPPDNRNEQATRKAGRRGSHL